MQSTRSLVEIHSNRCHDSSSIMINTPIIFEHIILNSVFLYFYFAYTLTFPSLVLTFTFNGIYPLISHAPFYPLHTFDIFHLLNSHSIPAIIHTKPCLRVNLERRLKCGWISLYNIVVLMCAAKI